jgi:2-dehydro-3-deoxy-L-fuconate 4-dehydrogenase
MGRRLEGKRAVITAAGQGIGRKTALMFAGEGAHVIATDVDQKALAKLAELDDRIDVQSLDVLDGEAITTLAKHVGVVDILFNCAGYVHQGTILECRIDDLNLSFDLNVMSMYRLIRSFLPLMLEVGSGSIVNMSSVISSVKGAPSRFAYGVTKAAVIGLTKAVAADYVAKGIRCNAVCPGTVETPSLQERIRLSDNYEEAHAAFIARQPIGRLGTPEEIASLVVYLASDESSYMTGTISIVDGGWST